MSHMDLNNEPLVQRHAVGWCLMGLGTLCALVAVLTLTVFRADTAPDDATSAFIGAPGMLAWASLMIVVGASQIRPPRRRS